ncbi:ABC transporter-like protein [Fictibacillus macauensis ZFHKF-1]|uniref:ABC transporter-like protein n=1 Tax=Fictibacillus macauensis ZFHKF-1 TaxID=1196324 RepID=I8UHQ8_9BACL|nr:ABC transporter ATP-binding protein [Fictibacillus macauensis]EIT86363.1 ABC transporter-like protein [Fictibacillus macauensis ZFHKF-1]
MIQFNMVTKKYRGNRKALREVTFSLPTGKFIGIVGENSSGKSTILKLISGLIQPTTGTVSVLGERPSRLISKKIAYLSENDAYYPFYTVEETVAYYEALYQDFNTEKANQMINFMQLDQKQKVKELSKGKRARLKMILTISREAPIILLDEPLANLDPIVRDLIVKGLISFLDFEKQTVLLSTHEIIEIEPLLDMVMLLKNGEVVSIEEVETMREIHGLTVVEWMKQAYQD